MPDYIEYCITAGKGILIDYGVARFAWDGFLTGYFSMEDGRYIDAIPTGWTLHSEPCDPDCQTGQ